MVIFCFVSKLSPPRWLPHPLIELSLDFKCLCKALHSVIAMTAVVIIKINGNACKLSLVF